jgi:amidase
MKGRLQEQGTKLFKGFIASETDPLIENFLQSGVIILGRTAVPEMGFTFDTSHTYQNRLVLTRNPWDLDRTAGGSSGGSAALVAAGVAPISMSSDGAGSTRVPAAFNGLIGLKATRGRVPTPQRFNEFTVHESVPGVLTRTVRDWAAALDYMSHVPNGGSFMKVSPSGGSYLEVITHPPTRLRMAISTGMWGCSEPADVQMVARARHVAHVLEDLGHSVEEVDDEAICNFSMLREAYKKYWLYSSGEIRLMAEEMNFPQSELQSLLDPMTFKLVEASDRLSKVDFWKIVSINPIITRAFGKFFERYDALLTPTFAVQTPTAGGPYSMLDEKDTADAWLERVFSACRYTYPANETGLPAISVPAGLDQSGLPIGVQFYANFLREDLLLQIAYQLEQAKQEWFNQIPPHHVSNL